MRTITPIVLLLICHGLADAQQDPYQAAKRAYEQGKAEAEQLLSKVIEADPSNGRAHVMLGDLALARGDLDRSLRLAEDGVALVGSSAVAHELLGQVLLARAELAPAEQAFRRALELESSSAPAQCGLGRVAEARGEFDAALAAYRDAIRLDPKDPDPLHCLGKLSLDRDDLAGAKDAYGRALRLDADDEIARTELAFVCWALGEREEAAAHYRRLTSGRTSSSMLLYSLGILEYELGRPRDALKVLLRSVRGDPKLTDAWRLLGRIYEEQGETERARECVRRAEGNATSDDR